MTRFLLLLVLASSPAALLALACGDDAATTPTSNADASRSDDAEGGTPTDAVADVQTADTQPGPSPFVGVQAFSFARRPFGAVGCQGSTVRVDFASKKMQVDTCADAGTDAGTVTNEVTLADGDVAELRGLFEAMRVDIENQNAACAGFDGVSDLIRFAAPGKSEQSVRYEWICSGPKPEIRVFRDEVIALRTRVYQLAGLSVFP